MSDRFLPRKLRFHAHGRTLVELKRANEKPEHRFMMALLWALYLPQYPNLRVDIPIGKRYRPDLVELDPAGQPLFWAEAGAVGQEKLRTLCTRHRETHLVLAKWDTTLTPVAALIERALQGIRRSAPVELIGFPADATRFVDDTGNITITFADVERRSWGLPT